MGWNRGVSDHIPIYMEIIGGRTKPKGPFKFSSTWLRDDSYIRMVTEFWKENPPGTGSNSSHRFVQNLSELKKMSKQWAHNKRIQEDHSLLLIESDLSIFENDLGGLYNSDEHKEMITSLYSAREKILKDRKESLRLRSRAIWMKEGDANTKFYHKFSSGRKAINTIWQLQNAQGQVVNTFQQLDELATSHFKQIYHDTRELNLAYNIRVAQLFMRFIE